MQTDAAAPATLLAPALGRDDDDLLTSAGVKAALGGISDMTLWRWSRERGFPPPDKVIARRKFWFRRTIRGWVAAQPTQS
jgi:predicted DNA-binding transcriptional regulator AlpA